MMLREAMLSGTYELSFCFVRSRPSMNLSGSRRLGLPAMVTMSPTFSLSLVKPRALSTEAAPASTSIRCFVPSSFVISSVR
jgi:hypothetical protein